MITLREKLILDCTKGICKVAQILKNGLGSPSLCAALQHTSKQKIILKSGICCKLLVKFYYMYVLPENGMLQVGLSSFSFDVRVGFALLHLIHIQSLFWLWMLEF